MSAAFSIIDHCYVPPKYVEGDEPFKDTCAFEGCGRREVEHLWTVEADKSNEDATR